MALFTLQTQLATLLQFANQLKDDSLLNINRLQSSVSLGYLLKLQDGANQLIINGCDPYLNNEALSDYADLQFATDFQLNDRIAGTKMLLQSLMIEIGTVTSPYTLSDLYTDTTVKIDDEAVTVEDYTPEQTATVASTLQTIYDNIPE